MSVQRETLKTDSLQLIDMQSADLNQVLVIERNAQTSPWGRLSFEESLNKEHVCRVVRAGDDIVAFHVVCAVADELHILNVVTAKALQGMGLGHMLMQDIIDIAQAHKLKKIFLEVRASNVIAQNLYKKWQFEQIAIRKKYYRSSSQQEGQREDALIFLRMR